jgi:thiamine biosynthesis lipoprotein
MSITNNYVTVSGFALGTYFKITYRDEKKRDYYDSIKNLLNTFENSLSVYRDSSLISKINRNQYFAVDHYFTEMFDKAKKISELTGGAFDISASPLFDLWGWGAKKRANRVTPEMIDSLKQFVGMDKIYIENGKIIKKFPAMTLNANAIAKGYASDVVAGYLKNRQITDYLVDIGGEIVVRGKNKLGKEWLVGIDKPIDGNMISGTELQAVMQITDRAIATSGDYRRFYIDTVDGQKYSHTIDPHTGCPARQNILSATVIADECIVADAYATAFMVMGLKKTEEFLSKHHELEVFLVYSENNELKEYYSDNIKNRFIKIK